MHYCGFSESAALHELPYVRGLQYVHAALLSQGAHCIRKADTDREFDCLMAAHSQLVKHASEIT